MGDTHWDRIKQLLQQAMQLTPDRREQFLDEECPVGDPCRSELESLLSAGEMAPSSTNVSRSR